MFFSSNIGGAIQFLLGYYSLSHFFIALAFVLIFIALTTFGFSVTVMVIVGTLFFGFLEIVVYAMLGILGSSTIVFFISRHLGREHSRKFFKNRGNYFCDVNDVVEKDTFKTITVLSTIFFVPPMIPNILGGVIKIGFWEYLLATFLGNLPTTFFSVLTVYGTMNLNSEYVTSGIIGLVMTTLIALFYYRGELKCLLRLSFPWAFRNKIIS